MGFKIVKTKASDNFPSDSWILNMFEGWFDPCPLNSDPSFDGLAVAWKDKTYVNPPYSKPLKWILKGIEEHKQGKTIVFLLKNDSSTQWYKALHEAGAHFLMISGRLRYGSGKPAPFPSIIAVLSNKNGWLL